MGPSCEEGAMSEVAPKTERGVPRQLLDRELGKLIGAMGGALDADAVLFEEAFSLKQYSLEHVERLLVISSRLELYIRCRRAWRGK